MSTLLLLGWENRLLTAALTASSAAEGLGAEQMQNPHGAAATAWQTAPGVTTASLLIDAGAATTWRVGSLHRTNLTTAATLRFRVGNDATFATATADTGTLTGRVAAGFGQAVAILDAETTGRYARFDIADPTNPQGRLIIPLGYAGPAWQPDHQWDPASPEAAQAEVLNQVTQGGQEWPELRWRRRQRAVVLPQVPRADRWQRLGALELAAAAQGNLLLVPNPEGDLAREPVFGRCEIGDVAFNAAGPHRFRSVRMLFNERL
jgi:hypothetical protein